MTVTITANNGAGTSSPLMILSPYAPEWEGRNIVHDLIGGGIAVSLQTTRPRSGTIAYLFESKDDAWDCAALHKIDDSLSVTDSENDRVGMTYIVNGTVSLSLDFDTLTMWVLSVPFLAV